MRNLRNRVNASFSFTCAICDREAVVNALTEASAEGQLIRGQEWTRTDRGLYCYGHNESEIERHETGD